MKKVYYGLFAGLLALAGCTNDEFQEEIGAQGLKSFNTINVTLGEGATTRAYISNPAGSGTLNLAWNEYDEIAVFSDIQTDFTIFRLSSASGEKAEFVGDTVEGNTFYVVYPYWQLNLDNNDPSILRGYLDANFSSTNEYRFNAPMVAKSTDNNFSFKQVAGMIEVTIGDITEIENAYIQGNNGEIINGYGYIDMTEAEPVFHMDTTNEGEWTSTSSVVDFWEDKTVASGGKTVTAYFVIAPTEFEKGITLYVNGTDKNGNYINFSKSTSSPLSVGRAEVKRFSLVNVEAELEENLLKTRAALEALYDALDGDNWANNDNWKSDKPFSEWYGIYAEGDQVREISLSYNNLSGSVPPEIEDLEDLRGLYLSYNHINSLPEEIGSLVNLETLEISGNELTELPKGIGNLSNLESLGIAENPIASLPDEISKLTNLTALCAYSTQLTEFPNIFGATNMEALELMWNKLTGPIPSEIGNLKNLNYFRIDGNQLEGDFPSSLYELENLETFFFEGNKLTATVTFDQQQTPMWKHLKEVQGFINLSQQDGYKVTVEGAVDEIQVTGNNTMKVGEGQQLKVVILPSDAVNKDVTWYSEDDTIVSVDDNGFLNATNIGITWIHAESADGYGANGGISIEVVSD